MGITVEFKDFEEMIVFAKQLIGTEAKVPVKQEPVNQTPVQQAPVQQTAPITYQQPVQQAPAYQQPTQQAPAQAIQLANATPVQTTAHAYTLDDLTKAAVMLMDSGRQSDLLNLLAQFGVDALPSLPQEQYGAFATALRGLGAQI